MIKERKFYKDIWLIALPAIIQSVITIGINMIDTLMMGMFGESQLSAASLAGQFVTVFYILSLGIGSGATVLCSQFLGKNDIVHVKQSITLMYRASIVNILTFSISSFLFPQIIMKIFTQNEVIISYGVRYLQIIAISYIFYGLALSTTFLLRMVGVSYVPLLSSAIAFFVNIFCNWVFIFGKFGMPCMEISGAALGTLIARIVEMVIIVGYFLCMENTIKYRLKDLSQNCKNVLAAYSHYGLPVLCSDFLFAIGSLSVAVVIGHVSVTFSAAYAIVAILIQISNVFTTGLYSSSSIIIGKTIGEGKIETSYLQGKTFLILGAITGLIVSGIIGIIGKPFVHMYQIQEETVAASLQLISAVCIIIVFQMMEEVMTKGVLRGGGDTRFLMIADNLFLWIFSIPLGCLAAFRYGMNPFFIYIFLRIDSILKLIWCVLRFSSKKWIHRVYGGNQ